MDLANSGSPSSGNYDVVQEDNQAAAAAAASVVEDLETNCWGCGLRVLVSPSASVFKCGWCGSITKRNVTKCDRKLIRFRRVRDWCFVCAVILFMIFFICTAIWSVYPIIFSISYFHGVIHLSIALILSICTIFSFCLTAFRAAGPPPMILWGSYPTVGKGGLDNYTFCQYCSKPKSPRAHHCRSCGVCVLDMDHHCPFIGNCVGAANHRCFVFFLISTVTGTLYVATMTSYSAFQIWPPLEVTKSVSKLSALVNSELILRFLKEKVLSFLRSTVLLPPRGLILVYLFIASVSVGMGLCVLLWQQLSYIYVGKTYLSHLSAVNNEEIMERDCQNLVRFFGFPHGAVVYLPSYWKSRKSHNK